ncbi:MAG: histidine phosphotransferase family protein [Paracoccus sp. (in: a-proteobacteria)]|nr:histidine phosphotransferase family protein [Paracoccus sp. (in: a-proteobacteria)]
MSYVQTSAAAIADEGGSLAMRLVALTASRLCHDLVSPLGAIGNGVELLEMTGAPARLDDSAEWSLIGDALRVAQGRIEFFRMAFGQAGRTQRVSHAEFAALIAQMEQAGRLRITLEPGEDQARATVRMVLLALMCIETAMPWGASVAIRQTGQGWQIDAQAGRTRDNPVLWAWLDGVDPGRPDPAASEVQFPLLALAAQEMGRRINWSLGAEAARISF